MRVLGGCVAWFLVATVSEIKADIKDAAGRAYANEQRSLQNEVAINRLYIETTKNAAAILSAYNTISRHSTQLEVLGQREDSLEKESARIHSILDGDR